MKTDFLYRGVLLSEGNPEGCRRPQLAKMVDLMSDATRAKAFKIDCENNGFDHCMVVITWRQEVFDGPDARNVESSIESDFHTVREVVHSLIDSRGNITHWRE
jgi:hypothetical protein